MSGQAHFNFLNMSNLGMLNSQNSQLYQKAMRDAANHVQLQKLGKKQLQQIAKELNIPEKIKKEEIVNQIPDALLKYIGDLTRPLEFVQQTSLRNHQIILDLIKKFQEQCRSQMPPRQVNMPPMMANPYYLIPQTQQNQLLTQYIYQQQLRQPNYYMPQQYQWMEQIQQPQESLLMCPCRILPSKRITSEEVVCINCDQKLHLSCIKLPISDVKMFECPNCTLSKIDPLNQIVKVLQKPLLMGAPQTQLNFMISAEEFHQLQDRSYQVEVRSIRLDSKYMNETTWPDFCEIWINQQRLIDFKPLKSNSSLKKRKDEIQVIPLQGQNLVIFIKQGFNQVIIKEGSLYAEPKTQFKLCEDGVYAYAIYMTKKRQAQELINQIKQTKEQIVPKEECLQLIQKACMAEKTDADVQIDKITIKVSLKCQFDCQMIQTPARGRFCTHVQCFSLENTITINAGTSRKWKCPVCKKKIFDFCIDQYQLSLLERYRSEKINVKEIVFDQNGEIMQEIQEEIEESEEEQVGQNNQNPQEEQLKQVQYDQFQFQRLLMQMQMNPAALLQQMYTKQITQLQMQQQQQMQKEKQEVQHVHQNKTQLKSLVEQNMPHLESKQQQLIEQLANQTINKPKHIKIKKFEAWLEETLQTEDAQKIMVQEKQPEIEEPQQPQLEQSEVQPQQEKVNQKSIKLKERMVRVIKKQFSEFIRKNFANLDSGKGQQIQQQQQSASKKHIYKLSEEKNKPSVQFNKILADQIFLQNPGHTIEKQVEDAKISTVVDEQLKQLLIPPISLPQPTITPFIPTTKPDHAYLIQKSLSSQTPLQQPQPQVKLKEKAPKATSSSIPDDGKDMENPICID